MVKKFILLTILAASFFTQASGVWAEEDELTQKTRALCDEGNSTACFKMGERYRIVERDNKTALNFYIKACEGDYMTGCTNGGILLIMKGTPYSKEFKQARKMFNKACDMGNNAGCAKHKRLSR